MVADGRPRQHREFVSVVETQQENDANDDRRKKNLAYVVIEDLLIRAGSVVKSGFFLAVRLTDNDRLD
jgi:hypothetical protein